MMSTRRLRKFDPMPWLRTGSVQQASWLPALLGGYVHLSNISQDRELSTDCSLRTGNRAERCFVQLSLGTSLYASVVHLPVVRRAARACLEKLVELDEGLLQL